MLRSQFIRGLGAALLLGFVAPPLRVAFAATPQDAQPDPNTRGTPEERMNRRYPQPVSIVSAPRLTAPRRRPRRLMS